MSVGTSQAVQSMVSKESPTSANFVKSAPVFADRAPEADLEGDVHMRDADRVTVNPSSVPVNSSTISGATLIPK